VLADVRDPDPYATPADDTDEGPVIDRAAWGHSVRAVPTLLAVGVLTVGSLANPVRVLGRLRGGVRRAGGGVRRGLSRAGRTVSRGLASGTAWLSDGAGRLREAVGRLGRRTAMPF
jgi:hypothetical protein